MPDWKAPLLANRVAPTEWTAHAARGWMWMIVGRRIGSDPASAPVPDREQMILMNPRVFGRVG